MEPQPFLHFSDTVLHLQYSELWLKSRNLAFSIFDGCLKNIHVASAILAVFHFRLSHDSILIM